MSDHPWVWKVMIITGPQYHLHTEKNAEALKGLSVNTVHETWFIDTDSSVWRFVFLAVKQNYQSCRKEMNSLLQTKMG